MNSKTYHNALSTLVLGFLCLPFSLWAQDGASQTNVENEVEIGFDFLSDDSFRYGKFSGYTDDGASAIFDFKLESQPAWDSGDITSWRLQGWRLGLESRRIEFDFKQQGVQKFNADYREIPNNQIGLGFLPYSGFGSNFLALPANWEITPGSNNTAGFLSLDDSQQPVSIERKRRRLNLNYNRVLNKSWNMMVDFRRETKDGERTIGSIFGNTGGNPRGVILPAPVDSESD